MQQAGRIKTDMPHNCGGSMVNERSLSLTKAQCEPLQGRGFPHQYPGSMPPPMQPHVRLPCQRYGTAHGSPRAVYRRIAPGGTAGYNISLIGEHSSQLPSWT